MLGASAADPGGARDGAPRVGARGRRRRRPRRPDHPRAGARRRCRRPRRDERPHGGHPPARGRVRPRARGGARRRRSCAAAPTSPSCCRRAPPGSPGSPWSPRTCAASTATRCGTSRATGCGSPGWSPPTTRRASGGCASSGSRRSCARATRPTRVATRPRRARRGQHAGVPAAPAASGAGPASGAADPIGDSGADGPDGARTTTSRQAPTPVTVVWGPTGAPGRTTVAVTLAAQLAAAGVRTLLVDLDTWGASVAQVLGLVDEAPGVAAAARASEQGTLDVPALARLAPEVVPGLRVLTGLPRADRWPELRSAAVEDVLRLARGVVDHVVVDVGLRGRGRRGAQLRHRGPSPQRRDADRARGGRPPRRRRGGRPGGAAAARPGGAGRRRAALAAARSSSSTRCAPPWPGRRPERAIADVLGRFAGMDAVRFLPWAPDECDAALLAGRALAEVAPRAAAHRSPSGELAAELDPRAAPPSGSRRRTASRRAPARAGARAARPRHRVTLTRPTGLTR